ncbi:hypothetical protein QTP88_000581 [Uroleucon formosanum]
MRPSTSCKAMVHNILYSNPQTNTIEYGKLTEESALRNLEEQIQKPIQKCGLFIDERKPYLAATPDGLVENDFTVEIKCPFSVKDYSLEQAVLEKKVPS